MLGNGKLAMFIGLVSAALLTVACGGSSERRPRDTFASGDTRPATDTVARDTVATDTRPVPVDTAGGDATPADTAAADTTADTSGGGCDHEGWLPNGSTSGQISAGAEAGTYDTLFVDSYSDDSAVPFDLLGLEMYYDYGADDGPHSHTFTGENYAECAECLLIYAGCDDDFACQRTFLASSGTLQVTENGGNGGQFTGTISDIVLEEVTIDDTTFESTVVPGGQRWCIPSYTFQAFIELYSNE